MRFRPQLDPLDSRELPSTAPIPVGPPGNTNDICISFILLPSQHAGDSGHAVSDGPMPQQDIGSFFDIFTEDR